MLAFSSIPCSDTEKTVDSWMEHKAKDYHAAYGNMDSDIVFARAANRAKFEFSKQYV